MKYIVSFLLLWILGVMVGCRHGSMGADLRGLFESNSSTQKHINAGTLPNSFVSVGYRDAKGEYQHLVGGFLVHPGVVLTSFHGSREYYKETLSLEERVYEKELYIVFRYHNDLKTRKLPFKVQEVIQKATGFREKSYFMTLALLFFKPNKVVSSVKPLPLATIDDLASLDAAVGSEMWGVGLKGYAGELPPSHDSLVCRSFEPKLGRVSFSMTSGEYEWMSLVIKAFPGRLKSYIHYNIRDLIFMRPLQEVADYAGVDCSERGLGFCVESAPSMKEWLQLQCVEHIGYPLLWKSPSQIWKVLGVTLDVPYNHRIYDHNKPNQGVYVWPQPFKSQQYDLVLAHSWLASTLKDYKSGDDDTFKPSEAIMGTWDQSLRQSLQLSERSEVIVHLAKNVRKKKDTYFSFCRGSLISPQVVLTAAHCLDEGHDDLDSERRPLFVILSRHGSDHLIRVRKMILHPGWLRRDSDSDSLYAPSGDIALVFLEENPWTSEVSLVSLGADSDSKELSEVRAGKAELWSVVTHRGVNEQDFNAGPFLARPYRFVRFRLIESFLAEIQRRSDLFFSNLFQQQKIISKAERMTLEKVQEKAVASKILSLFDKYSERSILEGLALEDCFDDTFFCLRADARMNRLEKSYIICRGDSGSPLFWRSGMREYIVGVLAQGRSRNGRVFECADQVKVTRISSYRNWIFSTLNQEGVDIKQN